MIKKLVRRIVENAGYDIKRTDKNLVKYESLYKKYAAFTMISKPDFFLNLELCNAFSHIRGDYVECGVWRGGMSAAISEINSGQWRHFHLFDSFEGLPDAKEIDGKAALAWQQNTHSPDFYDNCKADESFAKEAMRIAGNQDYSIYKGWFDKTMINYPKKSIAILRLDGDWYDSIKVCLDYLFPFVIQGGVVILDDYYTWDGCSRAVHDYLSHNSSASRVHEWKERIPYILKKDE
jgi:O-methyltransferase